MIPNKLVTSLYGPMIINANDRFIGASIEKFGYWANDDIQVIQNIIEVQLQETEHVTFYDVGANIGTHTVALAKLFGGRISVRSFEPQRHLYHMLCGNVALNGLDNVICENLAVSDGTVKSITVTMPNYKKLNNFGGFELMDAVNSDNSLMSKDKTETVMCVALDHYHDKIHFIKLDIEGMELQALAGAKRMISTHRPICFVEVLKSDIVQIRDYFRNMNYVLYQYKEDDWIFVPNESHVELDLPKILL